LAAFAIAVFALGLTDDNDWRIILKTYKAMIWDKDDAQKPGERVSVLAETLADAKKKLEKKYGEGNVFDLHNEEEASRPR
jgi:hypothetical protein